MTNATEDQLTLKLYQQGLSAPEISDELGIPSYRVRLILKDQGIRLQGGRRNEKSFYLPSIKESLAKGLSIAETAALIGKPYNTVLRWCRQENLTDSKDAQKLAAIQRYRAGEDAKAISASIGVGYATVLRWLHDGGVEVKVPGRKPGQAPKKLRLFPRVLELHGQGLTVFQIAQDVGVHVDTVGIWLRDEGFQPLYAVARHGAVKGADPRTSPKRDEGLRLYQDGYTESMISRALDVPLGTVRSWISRAGLAGKGGRAVQKERKALRAIELHQQGEGTEKIARALKTSYYQVQNWLFDAGLITERTAFSECAGENCTEPVYDPDHKYHDEECRRQNMKRRQPDPANWAEAVCANPACPLPDGRFTYRKSQGVRTYCSDRCSQEHTRPTEQVNGLERDFLALCSIKKVGCRRFDGGQLPWGTRGSYAPDFIVTWQGEEIGAETKGERWIKGDTAAKHRAWRANRGRMVVIFEEDVAALSLVPDAQAFWNALKVKAIEQESR